MTLKSQIFTILTTDGTLFGYGIDDASVYAINATDTPVRRPFLILSYGPDVVAWKNAHQTTLLIWAHDQIGSYSRIDLILNRVRELMVANQDALIQPVWEGDSQDLYDDGYKTVARYSTYTLAPAYQSSLKE